MSTVTARLRRWFGPAEPAATAREAPGPAAFVALTRPHHARLLQLGLALCGDPDQAADLVQETLLKAFVAQRRFRDGAAPYPWLARILRNLHLDQRRSAAARREISDPHPREATSAAPHPLEALEQAEQAARLHRAIARLPPEMALTITLVDLQGLSYAEAAAATEVPVGTVRSRLSRARNQLRSLL